MQYLLMKNENETSTEFVLSDDFSPYGEKLPFLVRPKSELQRPLTKYEKAYCWVYWLELIQDPAHTRWVLDNLDNLPTFNTSWGQGKTSKGWYNCTRTLRKKQKKASHF
jgi:hypothetical protein